MFAKLLGPGQASFELEPDAPDEGNAVALQRVRAPDSGPLAKEEPGRAPSRRPKRERDGAEEQDLWRHIRFKAERIGSSIIRQGLHSAPGMPPLPWAVLRPTDSSERKRPALVRNKVEDSGQSMQPELLRRLRKLRNVESKAIENAPGGDDPALLEKATALLSGLLRRPASGSAEKTDAKAADAAEALAKAFLVVHGAGARRRVLALSAALKNNEALRAEIIAGGPDAAAAVAKQDPREWACSTLQAKRQRWTEESLKEAQVPSGQMARCPECGGKAFVNTGRAGSGRAARLSKQYAHFLCTEVNCGKETHIQEG
mmetsp:Transcript_32247/g.74434  ORF Transcript_32247/g.74434 Transcript_32247/m.74434 type:complete len:315 (+) Transcript_32247:1-945(+)